ncbi:MAG: cysteine hydrolase family protein [Rhodospirillales bacterium]
MGNLTTLRDVAGMGHQPTPLGRSALVVIDCQNTYREGVMQLVGVEPALVEVARLLASARSVGSPVFHIMHDAGPGTPYDVRAPIGQISDPVKPLPGEPVIVKTKPSSFWETDLDDRLRALGIENLVLCGFMTHVCVNSTARAAFNLGYRTTIVGDATATRDLPGVDGGVVPASVIKAATLAGIRDLFAVVVRTAGELPD